MDTILKIFNSVGEQVAVNDDVDFAAGELNSMVRFSPDVTGVYYISADSYGSNPNQENWGDYRVTIYRMGSSDLIVGSSGDDTLEGGAGNDVFEGSRGADTFRGGAGNDLILYLYSHAGVEVRLYDGAARGGEAEGDTFVGMKTIEYEDAKGNTQQVDVPDIEGLVGSAHDDLLVGAHDANFLHGAFGNDELDGREGDDVLIGGEGADALRGGPGNDTASYGFYYPGVVGVEVRLHNGEARGGQAEGDTFVGMKMIEYVDVEGNTQEIEVPDIENLVGSTENDILVGAHGTNRLDGYEGFDSLDGREGDDWLEGGAGEDFLTGRAARRRPRYTASYDGAGVVVRLHNVLEVGGQGGDAEGDTFGTDVIEYTDAGGNTRTMEVPDIEHLAGSDHNDVVAGDLRNNTLLGLAGDDLLYGGPDGGHDLLLGGYGDDRLYGGKGDDMLLGGFGDDLLRGGPGNDWFEFNSDFDEDWSKSGLGNDWLEGGEGNDTFCFATEGGDDTIADFRNGDDKIVLTAFQDIQSVEDLVMQQQASNLVIDLSGQGGGTITLQDFNEADLMDTYFVFFTDDSMV